MSDLLPIGTKPNLISCTVVVPIYNGAGTLYELVYQLSLELRRICTAFEVILVNDGSQDNSWEIIKKLNSDYPWIQAVNLMRNYGQHNALLCGIQHARYDIIVTIDDDLQNPPQEIQKLLNKLDEGYDVVYGTPQHERHGIWRDLASQITKLVLQNAMGAQTARNVSAFRAFRTKVREAFINYNGSFISIDVLLTWGTNRFAAIPVLHEPRKIGVSNYTLRKLITHALNMMTGFSVLPLQFASLIGFIFTLFGFGVLAYVIGRYLVLGYSVPGFPFLASIIAVFSGAQLFALGIMGEYLARMHFRLMDKPPFAVRDYLPTQEINQG
jgi:undecaprenyl-phosphate 4-deoxy-4-formamido-L-arabinose transferase